MSVRRPVLVVAAALVVAGLAYTLYWFHAAEQAQNQIARWAEQKRAEGWSVGWDGLTAEGFPFTLALTFNAPDLTTPAGLHWRGPQLRLWTTPLLPRHLHLATQGEQVVGWHGQDQRLVLAGLSATAGHDSLDADLHGFSGLGLEIGDLALSVAALPAQADPSGHPASWRFAVSARDLTLPASPLAAFDQAVALVELSGRVMGAVSDAAPMSALAQWSAQGGILELERVALDWAPMGLEGSGTAALDPAGQPLVALSTRIRGFDALMDRLTTTGMLEAGAARTLKTILGLMAKPDSHGRSAIAAPLTLQEGGLYLGPARIAVLPALPWPRFPPP